MSGSGRRPASSGSSTRPAGGLITGRLARACRVAVTLARLPRRVGGRFARNSAGATAVEFALLASPFLALFGVVVETGFVALEQLTLDIAVDRGSRLLRTGAFQDASDGSDPSQRFQRIVCGSQVVLFPCVDLRLDISRSPAFSSSQPAEPFDKTKKTWALGFGTRFDCPQGGDTVTVRVAVPVLRLFQFMDYTGRIMTDKTQLLVTTSVFKAEDYESKTC